MLRHSSIRPATHGLTLTNDTVGPHQLSFIPRDAMLARYMLSSYVRPSHTGIVGLPVARTVFKVPQSCHITPILRSLHWLRITERIKYKLLSVTSTYKVFTTTQPL